ncbi:PqiB family protein [Geminicoccus harenae]|uniref:PqiB family protein n=1 Tax=Geminicoccus harenae TaxID=2498453 RepID=UPI00168BEE2D|nr:MlaD family protein [Geminicoccus harenae]
MSDPTMQQPEPARAVPRARKTFGIVWLVPLIALALALWVGWASWSARGPVITVTFQTASGIEAGKTRLRYRDIDVGQVDSVTIAQDLRSVDVTIQVQAEAERLISETSRFWVVRPRFGGGQISGLETLVSGAYIELDPGAGGAAETTFSGLETPPRVRSDMPGRPFVLRAASLGGVSIGSPVLFRGITVGEITDVEPPTDREDLAIHMFIRQPYAELVRTTSRFWRERGIDFSVSAEGVRFSIGNFETLWRGGVVFDAPPGGEIATAGQSFALFDGPDSLDQGAITERVPLVSYFEGSVRGLTVGAPVEVRGIRIGTVREVRLDYDVATHRLRIPVIYEIEPQRVRLVHADELTTSEEAGEAHAQLAALVERGLRAQLATGNLITGQMVVSLDLVPDAPPAELGQEGELAVMPTIPSSLDTLERSLTGIMEKVAELPIADLTEQLRATAASIASIAGSGELENSLANLNQVLVRLSDLTGNLDRSATPLLAELERTVGALGDAARSADSLMGPRSTTQRDLNRLMSELTQTARSVRDLADYLERHPEALLRGKPGGRY